MGTCYEKQSKNIAENENLNDIFRVKSPNDNSPVVLKNSMNSHKNSIDTTYVTENFDMDSDCKKPQNLRNIDIIPEISEDKEETYVYGNKNTIKSLNSKTTQKESLSKLDKMKLRKLKLVIIEAPENDQAKIGQTFFITEEGLETPNALASNPKVKIGNTPSCDIQVGWERDKNNDVIYDLLESRVAKVCEIQYNKSLDLFSLNVNSGSCSVQIDEKAVYQFT